MIIYGICDEGNIKINEEKALSFLKALSLFGFPEYLENYQENATENGENYTLKDWFDDYQNDRCDNGLFAFLKDAIQDWQHVELDCELGNDNCYYLGLISRMPWQYPGYIRNMSDNELNAILAGFLNKVSDTELTIQTYDITE